MTAREYFIYILNDEAPRFERVFKSIPTDKLTYKHPDDPKAKSAGELVCDMACEADFASFLQTGVMDFSQIQWKTCTDPAGAWQKLNEHLEKARALASGMTEAQWEDEAKMMQGDKEVWKTSKGKMAWSLILDLIHHRGQLSTYIRPM